MQQNDDIEDDHIIDSIKSKQVIPTNQIGMILNDLDRGDLWEVSASDIREALRELFAIRSILTAKEAQDAR